VDWGKFPTFTGGRGAGRPDDSRMTPSDGYHKFMLAALNSLTFSELRRTHDSMTVLYLHYYVYKWYYVFVIYLFYIPAI
jgi:hypothetical protein